MSKRMKHERRLLDVICTTLSMEKEWNMREDRSLSFTQSSVAKQYSMRENCFFSRSRLYLLWCRHWRNPRESFAWLSSFLLAQKPNLFHSRSSSPRIAAWRKMHRWKQMNTKDKSLSFAPFIYTYGPDKKCTDENKWTQKLNLFHFRSSFPCIPVWGKTNTDTKHWSKNITVKT